MKRMNEQGSMDILLIPFIITVVFFITALGFGMWAYLGRQDYKNNTDQKVATAVDVAKKQTATAKDSEFIEREKQPLKQYKGPSEFGGISISYPKTWSAYVDDSGKGSQPIDGYFHPNYVPSVQGSTSYALRVQVTSQPFDQAVAGFDTAVKTGKAAAQPYKPVNVPNVVGLQITGQIFPGKQGVLILIPLRDKTIKLWTEADQFKKDFNDSVLANFTFTP